MGTKRSGNTHEVLPASGRLHCQNDNLQKAGDVNTAPEKEVYMYVNDNGFEPTQSFAYELKGNSAVILRCFSRDTRAEIPEMLEGHPVTEVGAYAFSAHMDEAAFEMGIRSGKIKVYIPDMMGKRPLDSARDSGAGLQGAGGNGSIEETSVDDRISIPDATALAGNALEEIVIPNTMRRIGRYCFYNCANLEKMTFGGALQDWGAGAFTGVHHVNAITVTTDSEGKTSLKQVLDELHEEITVTYFDEQGRESHLVFPEYFEEGIENTPARILEERIHGSGMMYRNCIKERRMDFRQYDSRFDHAGFLESRNMTMRLAVGRLQYPTELSETAQQQYETYVIEHASDGADLFLKERDLEGIRWLLELYDHIAERKTDEVLSAKSVDISLNAIGRDNGANRSEDTDCKVVKQSALKEKQAALRNYMMEIAARMQFTEATGFLMKYGRAAKRPARRRFEL